MKKFLIAALIGAVVSVGAYAAAPLAKFTYDGESAAAYARNTAWIPYTGSNRNPFFDFQNNCANFVSQSILAGLIKKTTTQEVYGRRNDFTADTTSPASSPRWFYITGTNAGDAWRGAANMMKYAAYNKSTYKGLHFKYIIKDTPSNRALNPSDLKVGDVIFCDWEDNGVVDHVIIISRIDSSFLFPLNRYERIKIAAQSNNHVDTSLQWIIDENYRNNRKWASFTVYRPVDYNQAGL